MSKTSKKRRREERVEGVNDKGRGEWEAKSDGNKAEEWRKETEGRP